MATELAADKRMRFEFELALRELNADFCYFLDHGKTDRLAKLFTDDALYTHGQRESRGRDAIHELFRRRNASGTRIARHVQSGLRIQILDERTASGQSVCITFASDKTPPVSPATPHLVADFTDEYELCSDGRWRFGRRHIERIFTDPKNEGPVGLQ